MGERRDARGVCMWRMHAARNALNGCSISLATALSLSVSILFSTHGTVLVVVYSFAHRLSSIRSVHGEDN
jgi:hypothetical protein